MDWQATGRDWLDRRWRIGVVLFWLVAAAVMIWYRWHAIHWFALSDTDDNLRIAEVRAWLHGQGWYDLRQYRLAPPEGANIHWSRLVDLPIAGIILACRPFLGGAMAEKIAVTVAPLLPLLVALFGVALTARRLVHPFAWPLAILMLPAGWSAVTMFMPLRIDHHGWQLAMLMWTAAGLADPRGVRGGFSVALAATVSLVIGLEMLPYLGIAAGAIGLRWVWDRSEAPRLTTYGTTLALGSTIGFLLFASYDNRAAVCDALSPVWLSIAVAGGGLFVLLGRMRSERRTVRLVAAVAAAAAVALLYVLAWPHCVGMLEGISPELKRLWFDNVREARPIYRQSRNVIVTMALPVTIGLAGTGFALWRARWTPAFAAWASVAGLSVFSALLLLWQTRAGASAQLLAFAGATALLWPLLVWIATHRLVRVRVIGTLVLLGLASGFWIAPATKLLPRRPASEARALVNRANRRCPTFPALYPVARLPKATILTFSDLGPRLIVATHHDAIAGPYHRNGQAILDIQHAFRGSPDVAREVILRRHAGLVLICPNMGEATVYRAAAPNGFYAQLVRGRIPAWLAPVALPPNSPYRLWRVLPSIATR